jgi:hypothetical protein
MERELAPLKRNPWLPVWIAAEANFNEVLLTQQASIHEAITPALKNRQVFGPGSGIPVTFEGYAQVYLEAAQFLLSYTGVPGTTEELPPYVAPNKSESSALKSLFNLAQNGALCVDLWTACAVGWTEIDGDGDFSPSASPYSKIWPVGDRIRGFQMQTSERYVVPGWFKRQIEDKRTGEGRIREGRFPCLRGDANTSGAVEYFGRRFNPFLMDAQLAHGGETFIVSDALRAWTVLAELALQKCHSIHFPEKYYENHPARFASRLKLAEVVQMLAGSLGLPTNITRAIVDLFTFHPEGDIFAFPLIRVSDHLVLVLGSFLRSNPDRVIYRLLDRTKRLDDPKRGHEFARYARKEVENAIKSGPLRDMAWCHPNEFSNTDDSGEDSIDIVFLVGKSLFLGEIRTCTGPGGSYEQEDHLRELLEKEGQIIGNVERARANLSYINARLGEASLPSIKDGQQIQGIVITDKPFGLGFDCFPNPVIDIITLTQLLQNEDISGERKRALRATPAQLANDFPDLLKNPPVAVRCINELAITDFGVIDGSPSHLRTRMWGYNH